MSVGFEYQILYQADRTKDSLLRVLEYETWLLLSILGTKLYTLDKVFY